MPRGIILSDWNGEQGVSIWKITIPEIYILFQISVLVLDLVEVKQQRRQFKFSRFELYLSTENQWWKCCWKQAEDCCAGKSLLGYLLQ